MTMALNSRIRTIGKAGGVAAVTAPSVRRLARDEDLRDDVSGFIRSANALVNDVRSDQRLRRDLQTMMESVQSGAGHVRADVRPRHFVRNVLIGTGLIFAAALAGIAVAWPRARRGVTRAVDQGTSRATAAVHDVREKMASERRDAQAA